MENNTNITAQPSKLTVATATVLTYVAGIAVLTLVSITVYKSIPYFPEIGARMNAAAVTLSGIFTKAPIDSLTLTSNTTSLENGATALITPTYSGSTTGTYTIEYPCIDGVYIKTHVHGADQIITCNIPVPTEIQQGVIPVTAFLAAGTDASITLTIGFVKEGDTMPTIASSIPLRITRTETATKAPLAPKHNDVSVQSPKTETTGSAVTNNTKPSSGAVSGAPTQTAGPKQEKIIQISGSAPVTISNPNGKADFAVKILEIGTVDKITGVYTASTTLKASDRIAVRFEISNMGTKETGSWYFNAVLPTYPSYIYTSDSEPSLQPNDKIEFTIGFDSIEKSEGNIVVVNADPAGTINEVSEDNNIAKITIGGVKF